MDWWLGRRTSFARDAGCECARFARLPLWCCTVDACLADEDKVAGIAEATGRNASMELRQRRRIVSDAARVPIVLILLLAKIANTAVD
jgi:hypothetical protein